MKEPTARDVVEGIRWTGLASLLVGFVTSLSGAEEISLHFATFGFLAIVVVALTRQRANRR